LISKKQKKDITDKMLEDNLKDSEALNTYKQICDEASVTEEEIIELTEKRFSKSLPMDSVNLIVLMEMH
jgi:capsular polysaccharide biosynthesis protein